MKKNVICVIGSLLVLFIIIVGFTFVTTMQKADAIQLVNIDITKLKDGIYIGDSDIGLVKVRVEVEVADHKLKDIHLIEHQNGFGKQAEEILDVMIDRNTTVVDTISGATISSKVIMDATQDALSGNT